MESALYGIFTLVGEVSEISLVRCVHSFDCRYFTNSCENPVRARFPWSNLYFVHYASFFLEHFSFAGKSIENYSSIWVKFSQRINIFPQNIEINTIWRENEDLTYRSTVTGVLLFLASFVAEIFTWYLYSFPNAQIDQQKHIKRKVAWRANHNEFLAIFSRNGSTIWKKRLVFSNFNSFPDHSCNAKW